MNILYVEEEEDTYSQQYQELILIRDTIELMSKFNQVEILRILSRHPTITINENKYGIHINVSELNHTIIDELKMYVNYIKTQEVQLNQSEQQKETFKNIYFVKDVKDN